MSSGKVAWFNEVLKLGAILPDDLSEAAIVELPADAEPLVQGQSVSFDVETDEETYGRVAVNVKPK
jgi:cold shock CspA family protein